MQETQEFSSQYYESQEYLQDGRPFSYNERSENEDLGEEEEEGGGRGRRKKREEAWRSSSSLQRCWIEQNSIERYKKI